MSAIAADVLTHADYFVLVIVRTGALIYASPIFGRALVPDRVKLCLILAVGAFFYSVAPPSGTISYGGLLEFTLIIMSELLIGFALAFITNVFFALTSVAGNAIDMQIGFGMANVYDLQTNSQSPITASLLNMTLLLVFFLMDGQLRLIDMLYSTLRQMPIGTPVFAPEIGLVALEAFSKMFLTAVMVAMPVLASGLMLEFCFGAITRAVPQIHMMVVGVPLKLLVGFIVFAAIIPVYVNSAPAIFEDMFDWLARMFETLSNS
ncbi:MAG: flagellar biosynthetic protein FliR [Oscillospiraceae bacterium]|jgi:flagellar biosynthetic protein FliR|nr:flagellar biosynthetic protein FliR [Oscillospiraceae bacterium]